MLFSLIMWSALIFIFYSYKENLLYFILQPNAKNIIIKYVIFTNILEVFTTYFKLIYFFSNQLFIFFVFYHFLVYLSPALYFLEYKTIKLFFITACFYWLFTFSLYFNFIAPIIWSFFLIFQKSLIRKKFNLYFEVHINELLFFFFNYYYFYVLSCAIFIFLLLFIQLKFNSLFLIRKNRNIIYFLVLCYTAFLIPPDILSQMVTNLYLFFCYEFLILSKIIKGIILKLSC